MISNINFIMIVYESPKIVKSKGNFIHTEGKVVMYKVVQRFGFQNARY